jgi:hypothetical protein
MKKIVISSKNVQKDWNDWVNKMKTKVQKVLDVINSGIK